MLEFFQNFHFLRPWLLLLLLLPVIFFIKKISFHSTTSNWENVCDKNLLQLLLSKNQSYKKLSLTKYIYIGLITSIIAVAGPSWKKIEVPAFVIENPSMFVLSLSSNMSLKDVTPSRLERAKYMISDISGAAIDGQFGLEVYSQEPYIITPFTDDVLIIKNLLSQIVPDIVPDQGDRLDRAIDLAIKKFQDAGYGRGNIILFASDVGSSLDLSIKQAERAAKMNYTLNIVDTSSGNEKLEMLAQKGNGVYLNVKETNLQKLLNKIVVSDKDKFNISKNLQSQFLDYGYYLVFIPILCLIPFFRKGVFWGLFIFCFISFDANASFFLNDNQEGLKFLKNNQYEEALKKFKSPFWRSIVFYKQDKKEQALEELSHPNDDMSFYNKGVILVRLCKYKEALDAFDSALKLNLKNEDALYNKQVLEKLFEDAKKDPSLLNCENKQQNQQNQKQNNSEDNDQNSSQNSKNNQSDKTSDQNSQQENSQNQQDEEQNGSSSNKQEKQQEDSQQYRDNKNQENKENSQNNDFSNNQDNTSNSQEGASQKDYSKESQPQKTKNSDEQENSQQRNSSAKVSNEESDDEASATQAQKGEESQQGHEEALALKRQYREIPENVGGLLREFIKKEYLKDRYHDENK